MSDCPEFAAFDYFTAGLGRWHYVVVFPDGRYVRSIKPIWRYSRAIIRAHIACQEFLVSDTVFS